MRRQVEHFTRTGILILHQAKPPRNFAIGFFLAAKIAAKAILVELFAGVDVPQAATVGADFVGQNYTADIAIADEPECYLEINEANFDRGEHTANEIDDRVCMSGQVQHEESWGRNR